MPHPLLLQWAGRGIAISWIVAAIVWIVAGLRTKPVVHRQRAASRWAYLLALVASGILLLIGKTTHTGTAFLAAGPPASWLYVRFIRFYPGVVQIGAPLVLAGILTAFWALWYKSRIEERALIATFGDGYRAYRAQVKRLIPFVF